MKIIDHLNRTDYSPRLSVEIIPPGRGKSPDKLYKQVEYLLPYNPLFIDVTSHSPEPVIEEREDGTYDKNVRRRSPGTLGLVSTIHNRFNVDPNPHILCNGFTRQETEDTLIELHYMGIRNVFAVAGDAKIPNTANDGSQNPYALDLVKQIVDMNNGQYISCESDPTEFCIGVAAYPEKHFEAPNMDFDIEVLKRKEEAGAQYALTQMFFYNECFFEFVDKARAAGVTIPIIPGLKIPNRKNNLKMIPRVFHCDFPNDLVEELYAAETKEEEERIGVEFSYRQAKELIDAGFHHLHYYTMRNTKPLRTMMDKLMEKQPAEKTVAG
jgi:methylenetetrahydrofolate reductase (NADPH)